MRNGDIGWLAAVVLAALASGSRTQAVAPPTSTVVATETGGGPLNVLELLPAKGWRSGIVTNAPGVQLSCPEGFTTSTAREFTIVVPMEQKTYRPGVPDPLLECKWSFSPPLHAIRRDWVRCPDGEQEAMRVLDSLQQKLMELHEKEWFEVDFSAKERDRTEMRIRYSPVFPPDLPGFRIGGGWIGGIDYTF
jgi:hypothetical protein